MADGYHIESAVSFPRLALKPGQSCSLHPPPFGCCHLILRLVTGLLGQGLDFHKNNVVLIFGDNIDLAAANSIIPLQKYKAFFDQEICSQGFSGRTDGLMVKRAVSGLFQAGNDPFDPIGDRPQGPTINLGFLRLS